MAIIQNKTTEQGDVLLIKSEVPIIGLIALLDFIDDTDNEDANKYFTKEFRYSVDGVNYTEFLPLTVDNLAAIEITSVDTFFVEYRYTRSGNDATGELAFNYVELQGEFVNQTNKPAFNNSMFANYLDFNGICTIAWSVNVLEKLYRKGLIAQGLTRRNSSSNAEDRDYLDFWRSITHYYGLYVCLARFFKTFYTDPELLAEYLIQRGVYICNLNQDIEDLYYLMQNYLSEVRQRGTIQIVRRKDYIFPEDLSASISDSDPDDVKQVDGEYLRLICYNPIDEFQFLVNRPEYVGWNVDASSPLYRGLQGNDGINKTPSLEIDDLEDYNIDDEFGDVTIEYDSDIDKNVILIENVVNGEQAGIGDEDPNDYIIVNPYLDYEISFYVKQPNGDENLTFGCYGYDVNGNEVPLQNALLLNSENLFFETVTFNNEKYNLVRGTIFGAKRVRNYNISDSYKTHDIVLNSGSYYVAKRDIEVGISVSNTSYWELMDQSEVNRILKDNYQFGNNLVLRDNIVKIRPYIVLDNSNNEGGDLRIYNYRVIIQSTPYSKGFIGIKNFLEIWNVNRNDVYSQKEICDITRRYLIPYNIDFIKNFLDKPSSEAFVESINALLDSNTDEYILDSSSDEPILIF